MRDIKRRLAKLEERVGTGEPLTVHIRKRIIDMAGELEREETKVLHLRDEGGCGGN